MARSQAIVDLPPRLTCKNTRLKPADLRLLETKRSKLLQHGSQVHCYIEEVSNSRIRSKNALVEAARSVFVFAQEEAGTAVCVSPAGLLLTCSHCVTNDEAEAINKRMWLVSSVGVIVQASCIAWDGIRDLALLQIIAVESSYGSTTLWSCVTILPHPSKVNTRLICIGHPGSEDFESHRAGVATGYDVLHVSEGRYRGCAMGQDIHDNSDIGALKHDCWTYWGHSGAPLVEQSTGRLVGLHSSWDDETGMRRGVVLQAILEFLDEHKSRITEIQDNVAERRGVVDAPVQVVS